ncbi:Planctomycete cytochrome C [Singulisphaera sp. GP187]|uniref:PSD1 and planctomycete cytochrome C domain-containing protein n=1 Tax=Singulisphaera sp. GP187 TaxID=1882752 RepID=UPI0009265DBA|nr:PSD1 and planctomycete cytochrome C domain-containing protein [Singulisphaera sp. GP187]SIO64818.1 Planctomycete cytochrome C [Singulisphaera sp. GP187]
MRWSASLLGFGLILGILSNAVAEAPAPSVAGVASTEFFEARVRPLLVDSCIRCHGAKKQSSGLRLDSREAMLEGGESGAAIVPGSPDTSLLVQVVRHSHEEIKMPPKGKLPAPAIEALAEWVTQGAPWPNGTVLTAAEKEEATEKHWAFQPVLQVKSYPVTSQSWGTSTIDAFILAKLEGAGMTPSGQADKRTLIRRASFDLTGLPPTAAEIDAFEADQAPDAFAKVVERLLASPHYGERWGRHWLDVARYADTKGYVFNEERRYPYSYTYRDYVIRSFNEDRPYDQFLLQQIAADRLPQDGNTQPLAALGFLTVGRRFLNNQQDIIDDRIDVVTRGLLGLTVSCARCHDHKFDPIPTADYYSLYGVFASSNEPADPPLITPATTTSDSIAFAQEHGNRQAQVDSYLASKREEIQKDLGSRVEPYFLAAFDLEFNPKHPKLDDRARSASLPPSRLRLAISHWKSRLDAARNGKDPLFGPWHAFAAIPEADFARRAGDVAKALAPSKPSESNPVVVALFSAQPPTGMKDVATRYAALLAKAESKPAARDDAKTAAEDADWYAIRRVLHQDGGPLGVASDEVARTLDREERNHLKQLQNKVAELSATHPGAPPHAMVLNDAAQPVNPHIFVRGNPGRPGKPVPRQFLEVLSGANRTPFTNGSGRLDLAKAIIDPSNPLTARVLVNRVWMLHFGTGLVATASDFGLRSDPPSHPELLDDLATEFVRSGWSIKSLHRRMMLSSVYQQKSENKPDYLVKDPANRLLWRFPRRRLEFEPMRDALLAVSGRLDDTFGGRSVDLTASPFTTRRTVYGYIDRQNLDGVYRTFDFASPDATSPRRYVTTVPQQALFLMNSPFVIEQARQLATTTAGAADPEARTRALYRQIFGRSPELAELSRGVRFVEQRANDQSPTTTEIWQAGFGGVDESTQRVHAFAPFPHWTGTTWQFGPKIPDPENSYLHLNASGGHVGNDSQHAAIRRWTAPQDATITIDGALAHPAKEGDGVRGRIVASCSGILGDWVAQHGTVSTRVERYEVKAGETIDFVVDGRSNPSFDSFSWSPIVRKLAPAPVEWKATAGFQGPATPPLTPWEEYAQVLLLTNEFMFVD